MSEVNWEKPFSKNLYHKETSQLTCNSNWLIGFYMIQAFTERCFWIDFTTNMEFGIFSYAFFWRTSAKDVKGFYWLLPNFLYLFLKQSRGYHKFYEFHLSTKILKQWCSVLYLLHLLFTVPTCFLGNILFITQLKLSLDSLLLPNQKNGVLEYSLFAYGPYQGLH